MRFEFFKAFPPDRDSAVVEISEKDGDALRVPLEISRTDGELRVAIYDTQGGVAWEYSALQLLEAIQYGIAILQDE